MSEAPQRTPHVPLVKNVFFRRFRGCPLQDHDSIDYLDTELLSRYTSERGRIVPSRITAVSAKKQRMLAKAIKRSRMIALLPFVAQ